MLQQCLFVCLCTAQFAHLRFYNRSLFCSQIFTCSCINRCYAINTITVIIVYQLVGMHAFSISTVIVNYLQYNASIHTIYSCLKYENFDEENFCFSLGLHLLFSKIHLLFPAFLKIFTYYSLQYHLFPNYSGLIMHKDTARYQLM